MEWDIFISHASEDKESLARPIADNLSQKGLKVWLDENELKLGDSLREKIDNALANCKYGVVILSSHFFSKNWPLNELNSLFSRETIDNKVILPIWHQIGIHEIQSYSPMLADRIGVDSAKGIDTIINAILKVVPPSTSCDLTQIEQTIMDILRGKSDISWTTKIIKKRAKEKKLLAVDDSANFDFAIFRLLSNEYIIDKNGKIEVSQKGVSYYRKCSKVAVYDVSKDNFGRKKEY